MGRRMGWELHPWRLIVQRCELRAQRAPLGGLYRPGSKAGARPVQPSREPRSLPPAPSRPAAHTHVLASYRAGPVCR